jgi:predicted DNA-binding transcriptional regulator AlpA
MIDAMNDALLLDARRAATLCGVSRGHWLSLTAQGLTPDPVRLGRRVLWRRAELESWVQAGCPPRCRWAGPETS